MFIFLCTVTAKKRLLFYGSAAQSGGRVAGKARIDIKWELKKPVASIDNYLPGSKQKKLT